MENGPHKRSVHYATVIERINTIRAQGYTLDFNLAENEINRTTAAIAVKECNIMDIYRYEGNSDPADEAIVYAITSSAGVKGILVTGCGDNPDTVSAHLLEKLHY